MSDFTAAVLRAIGYARRGNLGAPQIIDADFTIEALARARERAA